MALDVCAIGRTFQIVSYLNYSKKLRSYTKRHVTQQLQINYIVNWPLTSSSSSSPFPTRILDFQNVLSWAFSGVIRSACISLRTQSIHLPLVSPLVFFLALSCQQLLSLRSFLPFSACVRTSVVSFLLLSLILFTPSSFLMSTLFTLSLSVTPLILRNILISVFSRICSSFFLTVQHSAQYRSTGLMTFSFLGIFLSLMTPDRSLHLPHAALTLALTASSDPPSSLMVTPKYLNLFTCLRLVPWLSLMFAFGPLLLLTITSVFPMLTFSPLLSIPICQSSHLLCISSSVSVTTAGSSANTSPDSWCRPTLMGNSSVLPCMVLTTVDAPWYVASSSPTSFSGTPLLHRHQYIRSLGPCHTLFSNLRR